MRVEKNGSEEYPYYNYKKIFNSFPNKKKKLATVTAVKPLARFGAMDIKNDKPHFE